MTTLNYRISAAMILMFVGTWLAPDRCQAQYNYSAIQGTVYQVPYYQVQVLYRVSGAYLYYPYYTWITVLETDDYEEAEFVYALYSLAKEQGILHEVAPNFSGGYGYRYRSYYAVDVQMLTKYRSPTTGTLIGN